MPIGKAILEMSDVELTEFVAQRRQARKMQPPPRKNEKKEPRTVREIAKELGVSNQKALELLEEELNG